MRDYSQLELPQLVDLLDSKTTLYFKMRSLGFTEEDYEACKIEIFYLQVQIRLRKSENENRSPLDIKRGAN